jgi:hypothetical protein
MKISVELQDPFHFAVYWLLIGIVAAVLGVVLFVYAFRLRREMEKNREREIRLRKPGPAAMERIRKKYLLELDAVQKDYESKEVDYREAFRRMSKTIRMFVFEATGIEVQNYTLTEIRTLHMRSLTQLVTAYYRPEFAARSTASVGRALDNTRKVIEIWN